MLQTLSLHGAVLPCNRGDTDDIEELLVPARFPARVNEDDLASVESAVSGGICIQFVLEVHSRYVPSGLVAQFIGTLRSTDHVVIHSCWATGVSFAMEGLELLISVQNGTAWRSEVTIVGPTIKAVRDSESHVKKGLCKLLKERYPALLFTFSPDQLFIDGKDAWNSALDRRQMRLGKFLDEMRRLVDEMHKLFVDEVGPKFPFVLCCEYVRHFYHTHSVVGTYVVSPCAGSVLLSRRYHFFFRGFAIRFREEFEYLT